MATRRRNTSLPKSHRDAPAVAFPAAVIALDDDPTRIEIRVLSVGGHTRSATARLALASPYVPAEGDRVLVAHGGNDLYVIGVLHTSSPRALMLPDGSSVAAAGDAAEIRDPDGRLVVRYANGAAEIAAPAGDLTLSAEGRVVVRSGAGIELRSGDSTEPQVFVGEAETRVDAARLEVKAGESRVTTGRAMVVAERIVTAAGVLSQQAERFELTATRLIEKTRDTFRDASDLAQTRAGRARTIVKDAYALYARRTAIASKEETSIDGSKILLG